MSFKHNSVRKNLLLGECSVGILDFLHVRWARNLYLVDSLVMEILTWTVYFVTRKHLDYIQYYMMLLEQCEHILA